MGGLRPSLPPILHPDFPYLVPPAHQPRLGAGLTEEIHQGHLGILAPLGAAAHRGWAWGVPGLTATVGLVGGGFRAGGQCKREPRRGLGRPSGAGGSPPLRAPDSSPGYMVCQPLALMGPPAAVAGGGLGPLPMGGQGEGPGRWLRRLWAPCARLCVCVCVLTAALAGCMRRQVVPGVGGALKGHRNPRA